MQESKDEYISFLQDLKAVVMAREETEAGPVSYTLANWLNNAGMFVISDRDKGLLPAVQQELPLATHAACMYHVQSNLLSKDLTKSFPKKLLWKIQGCTTEASFNAQMEVLKGVNPHTEAYLRNIPVERWALFKFAENGVTTFNQVTPTLGGVVLVLCSACSCVVQRLFLCSACSCSVQRMFLFCASLVLVLCSAWSVQRLFLCCAALVLVLCSACSCYVQRLFCAALVLVLCSACSCSVQRLFCAALVLVLCSECVCYVQRLCLFCAALVMCSACTCYVQRLFLFCATLVLCSACVVHRLLGATLKRLFLATLKR